MPTTGLAFRTERDYGNASDLGYRWGCEAYAVVRIDNNAQQLRELAKMIETVEGTRAGTDSEPA